MFEINQINQDFPIDTLDVSAVLLIGFKNNKILRVKGNFALVF
jgi:hypothetical protein